MPLLRLLLIPLFCCISILSQAQKKVSLSGTIRDASTGETLIGATVKLLKAQNNIGVVSNEYGYYSLSQVPGSYTLQISYLGYITQNKNIELKENIQIDHQLSPSTELNEVVIVAKDKNKDMVKSPLMGVNNIDIGQLNKIPVLMGEKDVLKTIQLLPGVKSGGEGSTGFFVRGGAADQNLILLDEAVVYNSSHLLGFFSTFNADAIKDVNLYKGGMPAQYGGRLSSVLDVKMQEGNNKSYNFSGGIGLIASRFKAEGPIVRDKGSFMLSLRRTYVDLFLKASPDENINGSALNFYDINAKANYKIDDKNTIYMSGYFGQDHIGVKDLFVNNWGNVTTTLRWNHLLSNRLFSNTSFIYNHYNFAVELQSDVVKFRAKSLIRDLNFKQDFQYYANQHTLRFGLNATHHRITPIGITKTDNTSSVNDLAQEKRYGLETALYIADEWNIDDHFSLNYGLRLNQFSVLGPGNFYTYNANGDITHTESVGDAKIYKSYWHLEPRFSASYMLNEQNSLKASYNRNTQNIHILSNATSSSPTDQYVLSSNNIKPEVSDQVALGYFRNIGDGQFEFSSEIYYKWLDHQIEYKNAAQMTANVHIESELLYGTGRAYGLELYFKKSSGAFNGWISYTLSKTERKFAELNQGNYFPARQDKTHDVTFVGIYNLNKRWSFSANYIYGTGNAVTFPAGKYMAGGLTTYYYTERNAGRMPYNMRLDIGATLEGKKRSSKYHSSWNFSIYNVLNRKNPYSIEFKNDENKPGATVAEQISLFGIIPSVTWNFKF